MLIPWVLLVLLAAVATAMLIWSFGSPDRIYEFPVLFGGAWLFFVVPQFVGMLLNPAKIPPSALNDHGLSIGLSMCVLCAVAGWAGYASAATRFGTRIWRESVVNYSLDRLFFAALALAGIGLWGAVSLVNLTGGFRGYFTEGGSYSLEWRDDAVRFVFFARFLYPALLLSAVVTLRQPTLFRWIITGALTTFPLANFVFLGRRQDSLLLGLIAIGALYFSKGWKMPRPAFAVALLIAAVFVVAAPWIRERTQYGVNLKELRELNVSDQVLKVIQGDSFAEFEGLVVHAAALNQTHTFDLGTSFLNAFVTILVPRQLVGEDFKEGLMFDSQSGNGDGEGLYGWTFPNGSFQTGPLTAFRSFWFFGALLYTLLGYSAAYVWCRAIRTGDLFAQVFYIVFAIWIPMAVVNSLVRIPPSLLTFALPLAILFRWSRVGGRRSSVTAKVAWQKQHGQEPVVESGHSNASFPIESYDNKVERLRASRVSTPGR